jgi:hypothetical protein
MSDLFDRFVGSPGVVTGHTADSGQSWGPSGTTFAIDGSGSVYSPNPETDYVAYTSWTPPGTDYAAAVVLGAGFRESGVQAGLALRAGGTYSNQAFYIVFLTEGTPDTLAIYRQGYTSGTPVVSQQIGTTQNLASQVAAGDTLGATIAGTSTPVITVYRNGTQIYQATDPGTSPNAPLTTAGSAGVMLQVFDGTHTDVIRTIWAGAIGGPTQTITPSSATVVWGQTQAFTAATAHPNETFAWTATHGSISGSATTETYTAPGSGTTDSVTWTSVDLPADTATASVTLQSSAVAPRTSRFGPGSPRRAKLIANLTVARPQRLPVLKSTPTTPRVAKVTQPAPPERPAVSDARPSKAKLDFPIRGGK